MYLDEVWDGTKKKMNSSISLNVQDTKYVTQREKECSFFWGEGFFFMKGKVRGFEEGFIATPLHKLEQKREFFFGLRLKRRMNCFFIY